MSNNLDKRLGTLETNELPENLESKERIISRILTSKSRLDAVSQREERMACQSHMPKVIQKASLSLNAPDLAHSLQAILLPFREVLKHGLHD